MGSLISPFSHINLDLVLVLQQRFLTYFFFSGIRLCVYLFDFRFHLKKNMVGILVARTGRQFQRYNNGQRVVVGCIPYRLKGGMKASSKNIEDALEVLVISAQRKGKGVLFPKGGWELDETIQSAALRETIEEAGVSGTVESELGKWCFKSKGNDAFYEGHMFPLLVKEQLDLWPEKDIRQRFWVSASQAKESCQYTWMREALDLLVTRLESTPTKVEELTY